MWRNGKPALAKATSGFAAKIGCWWRGTGCISLTGSQIGTYETFVMEPRRAYHFSERAHNGARHALCFCRRYFARWNGDVGGHARGAITKLVQTAACWANARSGERAVCVGASAIHPTRCRGNARHNCRRAQAPLRAVWRVQAGALDVDHSAASAEAWLSVPTRSALVTAPSVPSRIFSAVLLSGQCFPLSMREIVACERSSFTAAWSPVSPSRARHSRSSIPTALCT